MAKCVSFRKMKSVCVIVSSNKKIERKIERERKREPVIKYVHTMGDEKGGNHLSLRFTRLNTRGRRSIVNAL